MLPSLGPLLEAAERAKKVGSSSASSSPGRSAPTPPQKALQQPQLHFQPTPLPDFVQQTLSQQGAPMYMQMGAPQHIHGLNASMMVGGMGASMAPMGGLMLEGGRQVALTTQWPTVQMVWEFSQAWLLRDQRVRPVLCLQLFHVRHVLR